MFDRKVDLAYLEKNVINNNVSPKDLDQAMNVVENLRKRISSLSMVIVEIARALVPNKSSSSM